MKKTIFAVLAVCVLFSYVHAEELKRVQEEKARSLLLQHLESCGKDPEKFEVSLKPFGKSTWLINCYPTWIAPALPWSYVMDSRGEVKDLTIDSLNDVFLNEYPSSPEKKDREQLIQDFTELHAGEVVSIISGTSDIPGYAKSPLDPDIADALRAPLSFGKLTTIVYTYQQIGGVVRRYRFTFEEGTRFSKVESAIVGEAIGAAQYYD